jgi:hypothetical protein
MDKKIRRIALATALASTMFVGTAQFAFTKTVNQFMASLSSQVGGSDFAASRANIIALQRMGIGAIMVGSEKIPLVDLLAMIEAAEAGRMDPTELAAYLSALSQSAAVALFVPVQNPQQTIVDLRGPFPIGSEG